jgi:hypothetical protein
MLIARGGRLVFATAMLAYGHESQKLATETRRHGVKEKHLIKTPKIKTLPIAVISKCINCWEYFY